MKANLYRWILAGVAATSLGAAVAAHAHVDVGKEHRHRDVEADERAGRRQVQEVHRADQLRSGQPGRRQREHLASTPAATTSATTNYNKQVRGKEWFDSATYPAATFVSSAIAPAGGNQYKVTGKLTIKGKSQTVMVPVTVTQQGATQTFDGTLPIKRTQFDVGTGEWKDTSVVADDVVIKFHIVAAKK